MKTSRVPSKTGSSAATEKAPRLGAKEQTQAPASPLPTRKSTRDRRHHYTTHPTYSGTILVGEHCCNWLKPRLRTTTPTRTLYWVWLKNTSWVLMTLL